MPERIELNADPLNVAMRGGDTAEVVASLRNLGQTVDQLIVSIDGLDQDWYSLPVSSVALFPNDKDNLKIILHPPRTAETEAGTYPFHIRVTSQEAPDEAITAELTLEIRALLEIELEISPQSIAGRRGTYTIGMRNIAQQEAMLRLKASDAQGRLRYRLEPETLAMPGGNHSEATLEVRPGWKAFFGREKEFDFKVAAVPLESGSAADFCPYCGHSLQEGDSGILVFCRYCGHRLPEGAGIAEEGGAVSGAFVRTPWYKTLPRIRLPWLARPPVIREFESSTQDKREFKIEWSVKRASDVKLNGEDIEADGERLVYPTEATEYTIAASNKHGSVDRTIAIHPLPLPEEKVSNRIRALLSAVDLQLYAGGSPIEATLELQNTGEIVDKFTVEIEGLDNSWYKCSAASVALMPQAMETVQISFQPPKRKGVKAGDYPFAVAVRSQSTPEEVTSVIRCLEVLSSEEFKAEVRPMRITCRRKGTFRIKLSNTGVSDMPFNLEAIDPEEECKYQFDIEAPVLAAWDTVEVPMIAKPKRGSIIGGQKRYDITVTATAGGDIVQSLNCALTHKPFISSWRPILRLIKGVMVIGAFGTLAYYAIRWGGGWDRLTSDPGRWADELVRPIRNLF